MDMPTGLSLEQEFKLQILKDQVKGLTREQAQEYLLEVLRQNRMKDNLFKYMLKKAEVPWHTAAKVLTSVICDREKVLQLSS